MEAVPDGEVEPVPPAEGPPDGRRALSRHATVRDRIVEHLKRTGTDSISGITRVLVGGGGAPAHRLTIAGYLQALSDAGVLREMDRPPSKLYQLQNPEAHWSLHQRLHRLLQETPRAEAERVRLCLAALQSTLGRPIFQAELQHAGFASIPDDLRRVIVGDATRRTYRDLFSRRASPHIVVPARDPLLALDDNDPMLTSEAVADLLRRALLRATGTEHLVAERPVGPQQAQLDVGGKA
ncbi:MAG: hypothetical protein V4510_07375 [bacterium]